jgi:hypothetical protein
MIAAGTHATLPNGIAGPLAHYAPGPAPRDCPESVPDLLLLGPATPRLGTRFGWA